MTTIDCATNLIFKLALIALFLSSCASYKIPTRCYMEPREQFPDNQSFQNQVYALSNPLYSIIPRHRCQIRWYDLGHILTWSLFGNDDDGIFGEGSHGKYKIFKKNNFGKYLRWSLRNPFHNFCFYVIGSAYCQNSEFTLLEMSNRGINCLCYHSKAFRTYASRNSSFLLALHGGKPFVSLRLCLSPRSKFQTYLGWRYRGNFGCTLSLKSCNLSKGVYCHGSKEKI